MWFRPVLIAAMAIAPTHAALAASGDQVVPMHICSPDTHRAAFIVYSDGSVYYCANDSCTAIPDAPRNSGAFPMVVGCEKEPFAYIAMSDGKVFRCSAGISAPARCVAQRNLPIPGESRPPASRPKRP